MKSRGLITLWLSLSFKPAGHWLALGDQLLGCFELANDLYRCMPGAFFSEVPGPGWPAEDSHSPWSGFRGQRHHRKHLWQLLG